ANHVADRGGITDGRVQRSRERHRAVDGELVVLRAGGHAVEFGDQAAEAHVAVDGQLAGPREAGADRAAAEDAGRNWARARDHAVVGEGGGVGQRRAGPEREYAAEGVGERGRATGLNRQVRPGEVE